jgi:C4-dicarboxylate-specific signal transduction histidine kinase
VDIGGVSYCGSPILDSAGRPIGHLALIDDKPMADDFSALPALKILASRAAAELLRRQAERTARQRHDALAHMSRISTMGEIATGLAHEINQPLTAITAYAQAGRRMLADTEQIGVEELSTILDEMSQQAMRASEIIRRLRSLVRKAPARRSTVDVNALVEEVVELMKLDRRLDPVRIVLDLEASLPSVLADHVQLQQVMINLIQNALDAMDEVDSTQRTLAIGTSLSGEETIEVTVSDSGVGLPADAGEKIFDVFYSDKPDGLGMGLAISRSIVEEHKGRMWVTPDDQRGVTFHFTLPTGKSKQQGASSSEPGDDPADS